MSERDLTGTINQWVAGGTMFYSSMMLGGTVDRAQVIELASDQQPHRIPDFYAEVPVSAVGGFVEIRICVHIGNKRGAAWRIYSKLEIIRTAPTMNDQLGINSEGLWEGSDDRKQLVSAFDASRCWTVLDTNPVKNALNRYEVQVIGHGRQMQVMYGSRIFAIYHPAS